VPSQAKPVSMNCTVVAISICTRILFGSGTGGNTWQPIPLQ
jgi:hypothetical protein